MYSIAMYFKQKSIFKFELLGFFILNTILLKLEQQKPPFDLHPNSSNPIPFYIFTFMVHSHFLLRSSFGANSYHEFL